LLLYYLDLFKLLMKKLKPNDKNNYKLTQQTAKKNLQSKKRDPFKERGIDTFSLKKETLSKKEVLIRILISEIQDCLQDS